ncbi:hypothetical protein AHMF7605_01535 [Adhaeribacter arboris]|uniref:C-type lysozyme inhibitor domain-containing protein n=2 Tax=Adhaeribacter arboris TaxID=2072846 RepID=A0A2T2Y9V9_9BACT|nr:hypothetical protein AHMF7605_01535 [Adhaeribacter arboris]
MVVPQVIKGILKFAAGETLRYTFNNAVNTMMIHYQGETITLVGHPTGSGLKYANNPFIYTEWQDTSTCFICSGRFMVKVLSSDESIFWNIFFCCLVFLY